jgi:hypothetical protein
MDAGFIGSVLKAQGGSETVPHYFDQAILIRRSSSDHLEFLWEFLWEFLKREQKDSEAVNCGRFGA